MKLEKMVETIHEILPLHQETSEPAFKRANISLQLPIRGFFPGITRRKALIGTFYETVNRCLYGGELNDLRLDVDFENGEVSSRTIKPDVIDKDNGVYWESKGNYFARECTIMARQLTGYQFLQYENPETKFMFSFFRENVPSLEKEDRSEEQLIQELLKETLFMVALPLPVVLSIDSNDYAGERRISRHHVQRKGKYYPDCLCINPKAFNGFLTEPEKILDELGFPSERFEIQRSYSSKIYINKKLLKPFPIVRINDLEHGSWIDGFRRGYTQGIEDSEEMSAFEKELEDPSQIEIISYETPKKSSREEGDIF